MINKSYLSDVLKNLAKQNISETVEKQNINKLNDEATSGGEMLQYEIDDKKPAVKNNTTKITNKKQIKSKIVKSVFENLQKEIENRYNMIKTFGNDDQVSVAYSKLLEMHGMSKSSTREYEARKLNFIPPENVPQNDEDQDNDDYDQQDYSNSYDGFDDSSFKISDDRYQDDQDVDKDTDNMDVDFGDNQDNDEFDGMDNEDQDNSGEPTAGDILNKVIDQIRANPDMRVVDAFAAVMSEFDVDYSDQDDAGDMDQDDVGGDDYRQAGDTDGDFDQQSMKGRDVDVDRAKIAPGPSGMRNQGNSQSVVSMNDDQRGDGGSRLSDFRRF